MSDRVVLTVPNKGEFAKTVRMTAAQLATRIGMTYDEVDDVRMAAEEAFVYAGDRCGEGTVTITWEVGDAELAMSVGPLPPDDESPASPEREGRERYSAFILESVCDEFELSDHADGCVVRVVKRRA